MIRNNLQSYHYERLINIRRWQVHSGLNHFCFDGHCVTGRNLSAAVTVIVLLSSTYFIWLLIEVPVLIRTLNSRLVLFIGLLLMFYTYIYFFRSMCSDPGIILKPTSIEQSAATNDFKQYQITSNSETEINYAIPINEVLVKCKYCVTCQLIRPPRASHCAICSNCVSVLDHHCPFLNTCVGMRNYRFFIWFLVSLLLTALFLFTSSTIKIYLSFHDRTINESLASYFVLLLTAPCAIYASNLLGYQLMISMRSLTTREDDKHIYPVENPFNRGSWYRNLAERLCSSLPPSACMDLCIIYQTMIRYYVLDAAHRSIKENI